MSAKKKAPRKRRAPASVDDATERLAAIVEAAEEAASSVLDDAEQEARRRLEEAEARADRAIAERLRSLADELDPQEPPEGAARPRLRPVEPAEGTEGEGEQPQSRRSASAGARLLATQMAVEGASREEIEKRLRTDFEIGETSEILDAILGPEG
ncbi:MAG TPA: hypothetical protein VFZ41_00205 [Solirubrobacterales bacterium]